ncbi:helix-turn-helix domain-containing protein [Paenibacillus paeoniae]|uniref:LuxR family transcriptional regulator n=1 Tax=Paenibacillus paeoniae TaxID=2292705 RepID=A0A371PHW4_9BACL|nr:helix-turn-helix transcriptional regulator [Paenibacillus paeoniae]REK74970.1 LuxR family transcriptional regulator [Paenibacillus paeoniae]
MNIWTSTFLEAIQVAKEHITGAYLFLLTDDKGELLVMDTCAEMKELVEQTPIKTGLIFSRENCGVNAISEAMERGSSVYLKPEEHESPLFQKWHCYAMPLKMGDTLLGYLDVSTIDEELKSELIAIAKLISMHMRSIPDIENEVNKPALTDRQMNVLRLISEGQTVKSIAHKLQIKESTVNHHKKVIFEKLGAQSSTEAVSIAARYAYF